MSGSRIILAIDFGTTLSSVGYIHTSDPTSGKVIKSWPDTHQTTEWVPTTINYSPDGLTSSYKWGYQLGDEEIKHEWFKLGMYPELQISGLAERYPSRTALPLVRGPLCEKLVTDYLRGLKQHAMKYISEKLGTAFLERSPVEYIITVPAVWSDKAQARTRYCAENAGMGTRNRIQIITEPEAAGIYALKNMNLALKVGDTFVLCDAGGGTVDLISYTVSEAGSQPLIFESAPGSGSVCGSTFLNRIFDCYLNQKFVNYPDWNDGYHRDAMHRFEIHIKREFNGDLEKSFFVPARGLLNNPVLGIKNGQVEITGERLARIFEPVIQEVLSLVTAQIRATNRSVTAVLLAGGFGTSKYLMKRIEEVVGNVRVVQIEDGDTAIVRGALIRGLAEKSPRLASVRIDGRVARRHYGTMAYVEFDPEIDEPGRKEIDGRTGGHRVQVMRWFVKKRSLVRESQPASFGFYWDERVSDGRPTILEVTLYKCEDTQDRGPPRYEDDPEVRKLVKLKANVMNIPLGQFRRELGESGAMYYKVDFDIEMTYQSGSLEFAIMYKNKKYDTVSQEFE